MRRFLILLVLVIVLTGASIAAADDLPTVDNPTVERGFSATQVYQVGDVDAVNLFNGSLTATIPVSPRFQVSSSLSYQLTLAYNSNVWDIRETDKCIRARPNQHSNAGMGWILTLGKLGSRLCPTTPLQCSIDTYISPDGAEHKFYPSLHDGEAQVTGVEYTRDGSYLRRRTVSESVVEIDFPDGTVKHFESNVLTRIFDQFRDAQGNPVNFVSVDYPTSAWVLTDSLGRSLTVNFRSAAPGIGQVGSVVFKGFDGSSASYTLSYSDETIDRSCQNEDGTCGNPPTIAVSLLSSVTLPDTSHYDMTYNTTRAPGCTPDDLPGTLASLHLPTGGRVEWAYMAYPFPGWVTPSTGVGTRSLFGLSGELLGAWTYQRPTPATGDSEVTTTVTSPQLDDTAHYFRAKLSYSDKSTWNYSLPFTTTTSSGGYYLSTRAYKGTGAGRVLKRSAYLLFDHDRIPDVTFGAYGNNGELVDWYNVNRRVLCSRTVFDDDGGRHSDSCAEQATFDGLGHSRSQTVSSSFSSAGQRTTYTGYNPAGGTYPSYWVDSSNNAHGSFTPWSSSRRWVLGVYDVKSVSDLSGSATAKYLFDSGTGFLQRIRTLVGTGELGPDLLVVYTPDAHGNVASEQYYGGDTAPLQCSGLCTTGPPPNDQYRIYHTYPSLVNGVWQPRRATQHVDAAGNGLGYYDLDVDINQDTGLVATRRDVSGQLATTYEYDAMGRVTWEKPPTGHDAYTEYAYTVASGGNSAQVDVWHRGASSKSGVVLAAEQYLYDPFGRVAAEKQLMPDGTWSSRETTYNAMGWAIATSERHLGDTANGLTHFSDFDPFGRPRQITSPDGHLTTVGYSGVRAVSLTVTIGTQRNGQGNIVETNATTTQLLDNLGRLVSVSEPSGTGGAQVATTYTYDVGDRLVGAHTSNGTNTQNRTWSYDNRGFLLSETMPEKGTSGGGPVTYLSYDARGHATRRVDGPNDITYVYEPRTERLQHVTETSTQRALKDFTYGSSTDGYGDFGNSRLRTATRHNYYDGTNDFVVQETYVYGGRGARVSQRTTTAGGSAFAQSFVWNELGQLALQTYPTFGVLGPQTSVSYVYTNGFLTSVPVWANSITYHPNGLVDTVTHANQVSDVYGNDPNGVRRTASVDVLDGNQASLWSSGAYQYDGSGNIVKVGSNWYLYDKVSRLVEGAVASVGRKQGYAFDAFGNVQSMTTSNLDGTSPLARDLTTSRTTNRLGSANYDAAGNMTCWGDCSTHTTTWFDYGYYQFNDLRSMTGTGQNVGQSRLFAYTAEGQRIASYDSTSGAYHFTIRDLSAKVVREYRLDGSGWSWMEDYVYRGAYLLGTRSSVNGVRHYHLDHLGTPRVITNRCGQVVTRHDYFPFGEEATDQFQDAEAMKFTGQERDLNNPDSSLDDLDYTHARYYGPFIVRFLTVDVANATPEVPQSWNRFAFVRGNPLAYIDSDGMETIYFTVGFIIGSELPSDAWGRFREISDAEDPYKREVGSKQYFLGEDANPTNWRGGLGDRNGVSFYIGHSYEAPLVGLPFTASGTEDLLQGLPRGNKIVGVFACNSARYAGAFGIGQKTHGRAFVGIRGGGALKPRNASLLAGMSTMLGRLLNEGMLIGKALATVNAYYASSLKDAGLTLVLVGDKNVALGAKSEGEGR